MLNKAKVATTLPVIDLDRAKRFYREKLGLETIDIDDDAEAGAVIECGAGTQIIMHAAHTPGDADYTWQVDDIERVVEHLRSKGVVFEHYNLPGLETDDRGIADVDGVRSAWFRDTEGNTLRISEVSG